MAEAIATALLAALSIPATAVAVTITTALVTVGLSLGLSMLAQAFLMPAKQDTAPSDRQFISKSAVSPRTRSYGRVRVAGSQVFEYAYLGTLYRVLAHADGKIDGVEEHLIDNTIITVGGDGSVTAPAKYAGNIKVFWRTGDESQTYYTQLNDAFFDWDSTHKGNGVAHSLTMFKQVGQSSFMDVYPSGENTVYKQTIRGARVWDCRSPSQVQSDPTTYTWSDNAALVILDFLMHTTGMNIPVKWIEPELANWQDAANICAQSVPLKAGGVDSRYRICGTYSYNDRPADVLSRFMTACNGRLWLGENGGLALSVGVWKEPTITLNDDAIVSYTVSSGNEAIDAYNMLTAMYTDPAQGYVETEAEPWSDEAAITAFGERRTDASLYAVPSHNQCRRLLKQAFGRLSPAWKGTVTTNLIGLQCLTERFIRIVITELGLNITVEIDNLHFKVEKDNIVTGLVIEFTSVDATQFDFNPTTEEGTPSETTTIPGNTAIPVPSSFAVYIVSRNTYAVALATWGTPSVSTLVTDVEYRNVTDSGNWQTVTSTAGASSVETPPLADGRTYEFRAKHVGTLRSSEYTSILTEDIVVDAVAPSAPTSLSTTLSGSDVTVHWTNSNSYNVHSSTVYRNTTNNSATAAAIAIAYGGPSLAMSYIDSGLAAGTYWWWVSNLNGSGVESARTAAGTQTIT